MLHDDLCNQLAEQLLIERLQKFRPGFQYLQQDLSLPDGLILLGLQKPFLFQFGGAELFSQRVAPGNINVRIDKALLLQLGQ